MKTGGKNFFYKVPLKRGLVCDCGCATLRQEESQGRLSLAGRRGEKGRAGAVQESRHGGRRYEGVNFLRLV
jgi:hypothetical protein